MTKVICIYRGVTDWYCVLPIFQYQKSPVCNVIDCGVHWFFYWVHVVVRPRGVAGNPWLFTGKEAFAITLWRWQFIFF